MPPPPCWPASSAGRSGRPSLWRILPSCAPCPPTSRAFRIRRRPSARGCSSPATTPPNGRAVSYTHLRAHETSAHL
eukprot:4341641-Alexandrium_andersonii.AAC.1